MPAIRKAFGLSDGQILGLGIAALVAFLTVTMWGRSVVASRLRPAMAPAAVDEPPPPDVDALPPGFEPEEREIYRAQPVQAPWEAPAAEAADPRPDPPPDPGAEATGPSQDYMPAFVPPPAEV